MLEIAYCVTSLANKGPIIVVKDIVERLYDEVNVTIYYIDDIVEVTFPDSVRLVKLPSALSKHDFSKYDIVHSHLFRADLLCYRNKTSIKKWYSTIHADIFGEFLSTYGRLKGYIYSRLWIAILGRADARISLSQYHKKLYDKYFVTHVIYNGRPKYAKSSIDSNLLSVKNQNPNRTILGACAHIVKRKGFDQVIKVLDKDKKKQLCFVLVGDGPDLNYLKELSIKMNVDDRCFFLGETKNVNSFIPYFDLFVMTSSSEGMPLALIEAASHSKASVVSDIPMLQEVFSEEEVLFYEYGNVDSLYDSIINAISAKSSLENNIYRRYELYYSDRVMVENYIKLYRK